MIKYFLICLSLVNIYAETQCRLNIRGEKICLRDKALLERANENNDTALEHFNQVRVRSFYGHQVEVSGESEPVHIDDLIGTFQCDASDNYCQGSKVIVRAECISDVGRAKVKVLRIYGNEVLEVRSSVFRGEPKLVSTDCLVPFN